MNHTPQREPSRELVMWERGFNDALVTLGHLAPNVTRERAYKTLRAQIEKKRAQHTATWLLEGP